MGKKRRYNDEDSSPPECLHYHIKKGEDGVWFCKQEPAVNSNKIEKLEFHILGAGQQVGKSCILLKICGRLIMLDCGMHLGYTDERRYPDFRKIVDLEQISCVIITHFHLDHCAALPVLTEQTGYSGPIFMTAPTKAMCRIMLQDYRRIMVERYGHKDMYTDDMIHASLSRVTCMDFNEAFTLPFDEEILFTLYHAGHVLGACMVGVSGYASKLRKTPLTVVYTGDYNMTTDPNLAAAQIPKNLPGMSGLLPDVLITESTYATTVRASRLRGESEFLRQVHTCVHDGGKVLIPVFALGRAQELCFLLESYWERCNLSYIPIYFATALAGKANQYYKIFDKWSGVRKRFRAFDLKHIKPWNFGMKNPEKHLKKFKGPIVLLATSAMLEGGLSLAAFKCWAINSSNLLILPGHCVPEGTVGGRVQSGAKTLVFQEKNGERKTIKVKCKVIRIENFSVHTDAKGIMDLINTFNPKLVLMVHGDLNKMANLREKLQNAFGLSACCPKLNQTIQVQKCFEDATLS